MSPAAEKNGSTSSYTWDDIEPLLSSDVFFPTPVKHSEIPFIYFQSFIFRPPKFHNSTCNWDRKRGSKNHRCSECWWDSLGLARWRWHHPTATRGIGWRGGGLHAGNAGLQVGIKTTRKKRRNVGFFWVCFIFLRKRLGERPKGLLWRGRFVFGGCEVPKFWKVN